MTIYEDTDESGVIGLRKVVNLRELCTADLYYEQLYWVEEEQNYLAYYNAESDQELADWHWAMMQVASEQRAVVEAELKRRRSLNAIPSRVRFEYDRSEIESIRQSASIIKAYVQLTGKRPRGDGRQFKGECPFHQDDTPSFSLDAVRGLYHCFGCQKSGDSISLVKELLGVNFKEALGYLKSHC